MPRNSHVVSKSRHASLARPRPSATLGPADWIGHPPDHTDEPKAAPIGPFSHDSGFWMDDTEFDPPPLPSCMARTKRLLWTGTLEDETKENRESVPGMRIWCAGISPKWAGSLVSHRRRKSPWRRESSTAEGQAPATVKPQNALLRRAQKAVETQATLWTDGLDSDQARAHMIRANCASWSVSPSSFPGVDWHSLTSSRRATSGS